jgi:Gly-Xaa carboxypeptidase
MTITSRGGHSSLPWGRTTADQLAAIVDAASQTPHVPHLTPRNGYLDLVQCAAAHGPTMPPSLKHAIQSARTEDEREALASLLADVLGVKHRYYMQSSQATTIVHSGNKVNNLPEFGYAVINLRIAVEETVESVAKRLTDRIASKARELGLGLILWGEEVFSPKTPDHGTLSIETEGAIEPAPLSPRDSDAWKLMAGTIRHVFNGRFEDGESEIIVSPAMVTGNTDSQVCSPLHLFFLQSNP